MKRQHFTIAAEGDFEGRRWQHVPRVLLVKLMEKTGIMPDEDGFLSRAHLDALYDAVDRLPAAAAKEIEGPLGSLPTSESYRVCDWSLMRPRLEY